MKKTKLKLYGFSPCEDGRMAHMETVRDMEIPVNVFADPGTDPSLRGGETCCFPLFGVGNKHTVRIYPTKDEYYRDDNGLAVPGMIPMGTFSIRENDESFVQSPHILMTGTVTGVEKMDNTNGRGPDYCLEVETLGLTVYVYLQYDGRVEPGYVLHCVAWLYGDIVKEEEE